MKKKIDNKLILITGISAIFVFLGILSVSVYYGLKETPSLSKVLKILFFGINIHIGFFLLNSILIAILCLDLRHNKLSTNYFFPIFFFSLLMLGVNLAFVSKNVMAVNGGLFWLLHIIFQYQNRKAKKSSEAIQKA
jgi:hypothetical protein